MRDDGLLGCLRIYVHAGGIWRACKENPSSAHVADPATSNCVQRTRLAGLSASLLFWYFCWSRGKEDGWMEMVGRRRSWVNLVFAARCRFEIYCVRNRVHHHHHPPQHRPAAVASEITTQPTFTLSSPARSPSSSQTTNKKQRKTFVSVGAYLPTYINRTNKWCE
ncbi:hypothetical protein BKA81DRAFT_348251, partial [Phyllosticta paracitricarpa]